MNLLSWTTYAYNPFYCTESCCIFFHCLRFMFILSLFIGLIFGQTSVSWYSVWWLRKTQKYYAWWRSQGSRNKAHMKSLVEIVSVKTKEHSSHFLKPSESDSYVMASYSLKSEIKILKGLSCSEVRHVMLGLLWQRRCAFSLVCDWLIIHHM